MAFLDNVLGRKESKEPKSLKDKVVEGVKTGVKAGIDNLNPVNKVKNAVKDTVDVAKKVWDNQENPVVKNDVKDPAESFKGKTHIEEGEMPESKAGIPTDVQDKVSEASGGEVASIPKTTDTTVTTQKKGEDGKMETVKTETIKSAPETTNINSESESIAVEEEARQNGVDPDATPEEAKGAVQSVIDSLGKLGISYKDGKVSFPKLDTGKMGAISSALTALSVAAAIATGGAVPPMNFKKLLVNEKKEDAYIDAYRNLMDKVSSAAGEDITKGRQAEIGEDTREEMGKAGEQIAGTEYKDELSTNSALKLAKEQTDNAIRAAKAQHMNNKDMAELIFSQDVRKAGEQLKVLKNEYPDIYNDKEFLKQYATMIGAQNGITPNRMSAMTAQEWANVTKTGADTAADIVDAFIPG